MGHHSPGRMLRGNYYYAQPIVFHEYAIIGYTYTCLKGKFAFHQLEICETKRQVLFLLVWVLCSLLPLRDKFLL